MTPDPGDGPVHEPSTETAEMAEPDALPGAEANDAADGVEVRREASRRRRLAEVFGDVLPNKTRDDIDTGTDAGSGSRDAVILRDVPPHHG